MEILGLDHVYLSVSDLPRSEAWYDRVMAALGFRKGDKAIAGEPHAHYFTPALQVTIRPARRRHPHDPYAPGLHHLCLQLGDEAAVDEAYRRLAALGVAASEPRRYPEYDPHYYATFFADPDGIRLELVARRPHREEIVRRWSEMRVFLNPLADLRERGEAAPAGWSLWRRDAHENAFEMARGLDRAEAERRAAAYEARGHRQTYWIAPSQATPSGRR